MLILPGINIRDPNVSILLSVLLRIMHWNIENKFAVSTENRASVSIGLLLIVIADFEYQIIGLKHGNKVCNIRKVGRMY